MSEYANPVTLVSTDWVDEHKNGPNVVLVEVDVDTAAYGEGHIPGAVGWNWQTQLCDTIRRDIISKEALEKLLGESGIGNDTTIVLYGDNNNWFAAWALWQLKLYGHEDVRIMNGGRKKWLAEGRKVTTEVPSRTPTTYTVSGFDETYRAYRRQIKDAVMTGSAALVDVRSPDEYTGKILAPPGLPEIIHIVGVVRTPLITFPDESQDLDLLFFIAAAEIEGVRRRIRVILEWIGLIATGLNLRCGARFGRSGCITVRPRQLRFGSGCAACVAGAACFGGRRRACMAVYEVLVGRFRIEEAESEGFIRQTLPERTAAPKTKTCDVGVFVLRGNRRVVLNALYQLVQMDERATADC